MADSSGGDRHKLAIDFDSDSLDETGETNQVVFLEDGSAIELSELKRKYQEAKAALATVELLNHRIEDGDMLILVPAQERKSRNGRI